MQRVKLLIALRQPKTDHKAHFQNGRLQRKEVGPAIKPLIEVEITKIRIFLKNRRKVKQVKRAFRSKKDVFQPML